MSRFLCLFVLTPNIYFLSLLHQHKSCIKIISAPKCLLDTMATTPVTNNYLFQDCHVSYIHIFEIEKCTRQRRGEQKTKLVRFKNQNRCIKNHHETDWNWECSRQPLYLIIVQTAQTLFSRNCCHFLRMISGSIRS